MDSNPFDNLTRQEEKASEPKRPRGRPPKTTVVVENGEGSEQKRTRRSSKITANNVETMVVQGFGLVAILSKRQHWLVSPEEVKPWSQEAANLLNSIPSKYIKSFANVSGYAVVGIGLYSIVAPRIALDQQLREQEEVTRANAAKPAETVESETMTEPDFMAQFARAS